MPVVTKSGPSVIEEANYYEVPESTHIYSWSPDPAPGRSPATQVHLHFGEPPGNVFVVRFKSPRSLTAVIEALVEHRDSVWPNLCPTCQGTGGRGIIPCADCNGKGVAKAEK